MDLHYKHCTSCRKPQLLKEFRKQANTKDGLQYECRTCTDSRALERYDTKKVSIIKKSKEWQVVNAEKHNAAALRHYHSPVGRLGRSMKRSLDQLFGKNRESFLHLVGISVPLLVKHLASEFKDGQNWENYGNLWRIRSSANIDQLDFKLENHQRIYCDWKNLHPSNKENPDQIDLV